MLLPFVDGNSGTQLLFSVEVQAVRMIFGEGLEGIGPVVLLAAVYGIGLDWPLARPGEALTWGEEVLVIHPDEGEMTAESVMGTAVSGAPVEVSIYLRENCSIEDRLVPKDYWTQRSM